jgi:type IV pilus assembly protein PilC
MARFRYQAKSMNGEAMQGEIEAKSEAEARVILRAQKLIPFQVMPMMGGGTAARVEVLLKGSVKSKDLQIFTRQFATLINSGIPVLQSLEILANGVREGYFSKALKGTSSAVGQGKRLGEAMAGYPGAFDNLYVNMVKAGEEGGVLDVVLSRLAVYIEKANKIKSKVVGALWYPAAILVVAALVISAILIFVIPKFAELFGNAGQQLPWLTQVVVALSHFFVARWYLIFGGAGALIYAGTAFYKTPNGKIVFDEIAIDVPLVGSLIQKSAIARFSRTLSTLLSSGVGILEAIDISSRTVGNSVIEKTLLRAKASISEGKSITVPLAKEKYLPDMVVQMIGVGEQTGNLDVMLGKIADFYEDEVDVAVASLTSVIEPLLMVFLGGIIAFLVVAMYLPIFTMANAFG